jgi:hypothetical protein
MVVLSRGPALLVGLFDRLLNGGAYLGAALILFLHLL